MNYDQARQVKDGSWNYSRQNDESIWPIGYCSSSYSDTNKTHKHKSKEEAEQCYKKFIMDTQLVLDAGKFGDGELIKCEIKDCKESTDTYTRIGSFIIRKYCNTHRNIKTVSENYSVSGVSIHS
ncbi:MAG: hypothetical protein JKY15_01810 [Deltaproteobacteria bacterium]|nr:hypothetical protein [Deltaproteobacteria bacterium]